MPQEAVIGRRRAYARGESVLVKFGPSPSNLWNERMVIRGLPDGEYLPATPDSDVVRMKLTVPPLYALRRLAVNRELPDDIDEGDVHMVNEEGQYGGYTEEQLGEFDDMVDDYLRGSEEAGGMPTVGTAAAGAGAWVLAEPLAGAKIGDRLPSEAVTEEMHWSRGRALVRWPGRVGQVLVQYVVDPAKVIDYAEARVAELRAAAACDGAACPEAGADVRTLAVSYWATTGERHRPFAEAVSMLSEEVFPDMPYEGPRTTRWLCEAIAKTGMTPLARHRIWLRDAEVPAGDRSRYEHEILSRMLEVALEYDQLQVSNLAAFEILSRRMQLIEEAHHESPSAPAYESSSHFLGIPEKKGGALVALSLTNHVAAKLRDETAVMKERRKAAEAKASHRVLGAAAKVAAKPKGQPPGAPAVANQ